MSVKPYRDLFKGLMTLDGVGCSESFSVLNTRWGNVLDAVPTIATLQWTLGPTIQANYGTKYPQTKEEIIKASTYIPGPMALVYSGSGNPPSTNSSFYGTGAQINTGTGASTPINGSTYAGANQAHYVLGNFDRSRFILVCNVNARNETGATWSGVWGDYASRSSEFPYITGINYRAYYKQDLSSNAQGVIRGINYVTKYQRESWSTGRRNDNGSPQYNYEGYLSTSSWGLLSSVPSLQSTIVNIEGTTRYASYLNSIYDITRVPYNMLHFMPGVLNEPSGNHAPFFYYLPSDVVKFMNSLGLWWADSQAAIADCHGEATTSPNVHVPQIDNNGYPTGDAFSGDDISKYYNTGGDEGIYNPLGGTDLMGHNKINPNNEPLKSPYNNVQNPQPLKAGDDDLELKDSDYNGVGIFGTYFATSRAGLQAFSDGLWNDDQSILDRIVSGLKLFSDPIDAVISLRLYPFNVSQHAHTDGNKPVYIGTYQMGNLTMNRISGYSSVKLELGSMEIRPKFNNFLDLAPYTAMTLYIPFVGCIQLNPNDYLGETLRISMTVDLTTGQCVACVYASEAPLVYASGQMGVDIPVTCKTGSELAAAITTSVAGLAVNALGNMVGVSSAAGLMRSLGKKESTIQERVGEESINRAESAIGEVGEIAVDAAMLYFGATSMDRTGTSSPANGFSMPIDCFLTISRPTIEEPDDYAHTYGKVCHVSDTLANFIGFTVCSNVDTTGISATEQEVSAIKDFLESGVYV